MTRRSLPVLTAATAAIVSSLALYTVAARMGPLSVVAVLGSMSPVGVALLARIFDKERLTGVQLVGAALSMVAVALLTVA